MLVLFAVLLIFICGWLVDLWYWYAPDFILLMALAAANLGYGVITFRIAYHRWSERMLQGMSYPLLAYSYVYNADIYSQVVGQAEALQLFYMTLIVIATPVLAIAGPVRAAILGVFMDEDDPDPPEEV